MILMFKCQLCQLPILFIPKIQKLQQSYTRIRKHFRLLRTQLQAPTPLTPTFIFLDINIRTRIQTINYFDSIGIKIKIIDCYL